MTERDLLSALDDQHEQERPPGWYTISEIVRVKGGNRSSWSTRLANMPGVECREFKIRISGKVHACKCYRLEAPKKTKRKSSE